MITTSASSAEIKQVRLSPRTVVGLRERVSVGDLAGFFAHTMPAVVAELSRAGIKPIGAPVAVYRQEIGDTFEVTFGFPVDRAPGSDALVRMPLPGGLAVQAMHAGSYETLPGTYERLGEWFADRRLQPPTLMWEEYTVGPDGDDETPCRTRVVFPLR